MPDTNEELLRDESAFAGFSRTDVGMVPNPSLGDSSFQKELRGAAGSVVTLAVPASATVLQ